MQKNYRLSLTFLFSIVFSLSTLAQDASKYKDVVLDGKPAKLNVETGEITIIYSKIKNATDTIPVVTKPESKTLVKPKIISNHSSKSSDFHVVRRGEKLLDISKRYNLSLTQLMEVNNLETTLIRKGQKLRIRNLEDSNKTIRITETLKVKPTSNKNSSDIHVVKKGETLYSLSKLYSVNLEDLKRNNNLISNLIKIGQKLQVGNFKASKLLVWTVSKGDTLYSIARRNETTVAQIKELNGLTSNLIKIGQILKLR